MPKEISETTAKVDAKGRVMIPKRLGKTAKLKEGSLVNFRTKAKTIKEPVERVAEKYYGTFKINKWPENLDEFVTAVQLKKNLASEKPLPS